MGEGNVLQGICKVYLSHVHSWIQALLCKLDISAEFLKLSISTNKFYQLLKKLCRDNRKNEGEHHEVFLAVIDPIFACFVTRMSLKVALSCIFSESGQLASNFTVRFGIIFTKHINRCKLLLSEPYMRSFLRQEFHSFAASPSIMFNEKTRC